MLEVTDVAAAKLAAHMKANGQGKAIRIDLRKGG
jgi:Fe-S cluster assembly iron-binding protein IscA